MPRFDTNDEMYEYHEGLNISEETMMKHNSVHQMCEVSGCLNEAEYSGWYRKLDAFSIQTGLMKRACVCSKHLNYLIGG